MPEFDRHHRTLKVMTEEIVVEPTDVENPAEPSADESPVADELVEEELLVEEISIDGMCGVY